MRVHLIEPDPDLQQALVFLLQHDGHDVSVSPSLARPSQAPRVPEAPILIVRVQAPEESTSVRRIVEKRASRPTLVLVAGADRAATARSIGLPDERCLGLPLVPSELREVLNELDLSVADSAP